MSASRLRICAWIENVERRDRLVEDQHPRLGGQGAGDRDALALAARQRPRTCAQLARVEAHQLAQLGDPRASLLPRAAAAVQPQHLVDRLLGAVTRVEAGVRVLEDDLHLAAAHAALAGGAHGGAAIAPAGENRAGARRREPDEHLRHGRLAGAGLADDRQRAARGHPQVDVRDGDGLAEPLVQPRRLEHRLTHGAPPPPARCAARPSGCSARRRRRAARAAAARRGRRPARRRSGARTRSRPAPRRR